MKTEKIYENDGMCFSFRANILETRENEKGFALMLDRTAFFPEGGGQTADHGTIAGVSVMDVQIENGEIWHYVDALPKETEVEGILDRAERLRKMQNHLGEHLLCGAIHKLYGYDNVGFHLGADYMTFDVNGTMTWDEIYEAEKLANLAVAEDVQVRTYVPTKEELRALSYRAKSEKLENEEEIRIVEVESFDRCACCAPHLDRAGKVGLIKIVEAMHYKGGMRFHAFCGFDALHDYSARLCEIRKMTALLSAKPHEVSLAVEARLAELSEAKKTIGAMKREIVRLKLDAITLCEGNITIFDPALDGNAMREFATVGMTKAGGIFSVFSGSEEEGYQFVIASETVALKGKIAEYREKLCGKCGGSDKMLFGHAAVSRAVIEELFAK